MALKHISVSSFQFSNCVVWTKWLQIDTLFFIQTAISEGFLLTSLAEVYIMQWFQQTNVHLVLNLCILNCFKTLQQCCLFCIPPPIWRLKLLPSILNGKINVSSTWTWFRGRVQCGNGEGILTRQWQNQ